MPCKLMQCEFIQFKELANVSLVGKKSIHLQAFFLH